MADKNNKLVRCGQLVGFFFNLYNLNSRHWTYGYYIC